MTTASDHDEIIVDAWGDGRVSISNPMTHRRVLVRPQQAAEWIAGAHSKIDESLSGEPVVDDPGRQGELHWQERAWDWALPYYLWSRRGEFLDRDDQTAAAPLLETYRLADGDVPLPRRAPATALPLPAPELTSGPSLHEVLLRRATVRRFRDRPMPVNLLGGLLWASFAGVRRLRASSSDVREPLRSFASAVDFALIVYDVTGLGSGLWWYDVGSHRVWGHQPGDFRTEVNDVLWRQGPPLSASGTLVLIADFERYQWRYRHERALRNLYIDAGRLAHAFLLVAAASRVGCFVTPATDDTRLSDFLALDLDREGPLYTITFGMATDR